MTNEELFNELTSGLTRKTDFKEYPDSIFFFKGDQWMIEYDINFGILWFNYETIWVVLRDKNKWYNNEMQLFIKNQVEKHFKPKEVTPHAIASGMKDWVEKHFKDKKS